MGRRAEYEIPEGLKEAQERFAEWRSSHTGRRPIPEPLWALAGELASQHGVFRTSQVLRLDYNKLKRHTQTVAPVGKQPSVPTTAFVELMTSAFPQGCECVIEVEGQRGRMRIEWKGPGAPDLTGLSRMLWEEPGT